MSSAKRRNVVVRHVDHLVIDRRQHVEFRQECARCVLDDLSCLLVAVNDVRYVLNAFLEVFDTLWPANSVVANVLTYLKEGELPFTVNRDIETICDAES